VARAFRRRGRGADERFVAVLDEAERGVVVGLLEQVRDLLDDAYEEADGSAAAAPGETGDPAFDAIVSGLGGMGQGVSLAAEDQVDLSASPDPALARLFPPAHRDDDEVAAQFRAMTQDGLRDRKLANLRTAIAAIGGASDKHVRLGRPDATALMVALTDVRLVLAERIGVHTEEDTERLREIAANADPDEPIVYASAVYDFLSWLQEGLAEALLP
jgi:hypothetical protein